MTLRSVLFLFGLALFHAPSANAGWDSLLDQGDGARVRFGAALEGREPYRRNSEEAFAPASTAKLFTAGAALARFGADFRFSTIVRWTFTGPGRAANLTLVGTGDPSWGVPELGERLRDRLDRIADALKNAGIDEVAGEPQAMATDPRWNAVTVPAGWKESDTTSCGGALAFAFNFSLNCAMLRVTSPLRAVWATEGLNLPVTLRIRAGSSTSLEVRTVSTTRGIGYLVEGTWKSGSSVQAFTLPVYDTRAWAAALFRNALAARGIRFVPALEKPASGEEKQLTFYSPTLSEILKPFLKNSVNFLGDALLRSLGAAGSGPLLESGLSSLATYLRATVGDTRDLILNDGSGLSRTARVRPDFVLRYLEEIARAPYFPALLAALPVAGVDGTLKNRMKGTSAEGALRGKTGTLDGVYNLAGYVPDGKRFVPFVLLTRTTSALSSAARAAEDRVGARLASLHDSRDLQLESLVPYPYYPEHAGFDAQ